MIDDGVIKFKCEWKKTPLTFPEETLTEIIDVRNELYRRGLIGEYPNGIGFGNVSLRNPNGAGFIITGTQTGNVQNLTSQSLTYVKTYDIQKNRVVCEGPVQASSESLTHAMVYELDSAIQAIIHTHHRASWLKLIHKIPTTAETVPYGTPEMAREVKRLYQTTDLKNGKIFAMAGHEEGIIAFGNNFKEAKKILFLGLSLG